MTAINIIKESFKNFYEYLFQFVIINLISFAIILLPFSLLAISNTYFMLLISLFCFAIIAGPLILSGMEYVNNSLNREEASIKNFFIGIKDNFKKGVSAFLFIIAGYFVILVDIYFFLQYSENFLMMVISIMFFYFLILFSMFQLYFWPSMVIEKDLSFLQTIKRSFLLIVDNFVQTGIIFIFVLIILFLNLILPFLMPFFIFTFLSLVLVLLSRTILEKYIEQE